MTYSVSVIIKLVEEYLQDHNFYEIEVVGEDLEQYRKNLYNASRRAKKRWRFTLDRTKNSVFVYRS